MSNVVFDGKLVRKVHFTDAFRKTLQQTPSGSVVVFTGLNRDAVSAACTLMVGLDHRCKYYDVDQVLVGVLSWGRQDGDVLSSFRYSMEVLPLIGFGHLTDSFVGAIVNSKSSKFHMWLRQALKKRVMRGQTTVIAAAGLKDDGKFLGIDVISQYGVVVDSQDVIEGDNKRGKKEKLGKVKEPSSSSFKHKTEGNVCRVRDRSDKELGNQRDRGKNGKGDPFTVG